MAKSGIDMTFRTFGCARTAPPSGLAKKRMADTAIRIRDWQYIVCRPAEQDHAAPGLQDPHVQACLH